MKNFLLLKKISVKSFFIHKFSVLSILNIMRLCNASYSVLAAFELFYNIFYSYLLNFFYLLKFLKIKAYLYLVLTFTRLQSFYSFLNTNLALFKAFSSGLLLKYFFIVSKKIRRLVQKQRPVFNFLKKFFFLRLAQGCEFWVYGFKKKYLPVIVELSNWAWIFNFVWVLKKSFGQYKYRRVVAIKKRIRKNLRTRVH